MPALYSEDAQNYYAEAYACGCCGRAYHDRDGEHAPAGALCEDCLREGVQVGDGPNDMSYAVYCEREAEEIGIYPNH